MNHTRFCLLLSASLLVLAASIASAQIPAGLVPNGSQPLPGGPYSGHPPTSMVEVNDVPASHLTDTPSTWTKTFNWDYSGGSISPGDELCVQEFIPLLYPASTPPSALLSLTDWHEMILHVDNDIPLMWDTSNVSVKVNGSPITSLASGGTDLSITFAPITIPVDTGTTSPITFEVDKYLKYVGDHTITSGGMGDNFNIIVSEMPTTPEPSSLVLLSLGAAGLWYGRSRRKRI